MLRRTAHLDIGGDADLSSGKYAAQEVRWAARAQGRRPALPAVESLGLLLGGWNREDRVVGDVKQALCDATEEKARNGAEPSRPDDD
jgi:hypothetical protein